MAPVQKVFPSLNPSATTKDGTFLRTGSFVSVSRFQFEEQRHRWALRKDARQKRFLPSCRAPEVTDKTWRLLFVWVMLFGWRPGLFSLAVSLAISLSPRFGSSVLEIRFGGQRGRRIVTVQDVRTCNQKTEQIRGSVIPRLGASRSFWRVGV